MLDFEERVRLGFGAGFDGAESGAVSIDSDAVVEAAEERRVASAARVEKADEHVTVAALETE